MKLNDNAIRWFALAGAAVMYAGAVIYGDIMFIQVVGVTFPTGFLGTLALVGALVTAGSALILPAALHFWFAPGRQFVWGVIYWAADISALALNSMLAYQVASKQPLDGLMLGWYALAPATPMLAVVGWGLVFLFDPSHKIRHAQAGLEAEQIEIYTTRLAAAARSETVRDEIDGAARAAAEWYASRLNTIAPSRNGHKVKATTFSTDGAEAPKGKKRQ